MKKKKCAVCMLPPVRSFIQRTLVVLIDRQVRLLVWLPEHSRGRCEEHFRVGFSQSTVLHLPSGPFEEKPWGIERK
jgi:hypothetical protein